MGVPPPSDRQCIGLVLDLVHAMETGQFPFPGALRDQPRHMTDWFRIVQSYAIRSRAMAARGGMMVAQAGDVAEGDCEGVDGSARNRDQGTVRRRSVFDP